MVLFIVYPGKYDDTRYLWEYIKLHKYKHLERKMKNKKTGHRNKLYMIYLGEVCVYLL